MSTARNVSEPAAQILDTISDGFFALDDDLVVTYFNSAAELILGRKRDEVLGRPLFDSFPEARGSIFEEKYTWALRERQFVTFDTYFDVPPYRNWYEVRVYPQRQGIAVYFKTDTDRKLAAEALRMSEARFRAAQELSLDAFTVLESVRDERGTIVDFCWVYVNPAAGHILRHPPEELVNQCLLAVLPGSKELSDLFERYVRVVETGEPHDIELHYDSEGIEGWFRNMAVKLNDGLAVSFSDITERKRTEKHLRLLETVAASLSAAITPTQATEIIITQGFSAIGAAAGSVFILRDPYIFELVKSVGYSPELVESWKQIDVRTASAPLATAIRNKAPVFLGSWADRQGEYAPDQTRPVDTVHQAWAALPLIVNERVIGGIGLSYTKPRAFDDEERRFMTTLAHHCAQALERTRLTEQAKELAATAERQRLARDLHDAVSQVLFSSTTIAEALPRQWERDPETTFDLLKQVVVFNRAAMAEMRTLLFELRPESIEHTDLGTLLNYLVDASRGRKLMEATLVVEGEPCRLPPDVHIALYRIAQESINNILKHSQAAACTVLLSQEAGGIVLSVRDNGQGFDVGKFSGGLGLSIMQERAEAIGAKLTIASQPGGGTLVQVQWRPA